MFDNSFLSDRVYLKGSLKNSDTGFEFTLRNQIDTGTLAGFKSLSVDGFEIPQNSISLHTPDGVWPVAEVDFSNPVSLKLGHHARIVVAGKPLTPGQHNFVLTINVMEIGRAQLKFTDMV